MRKLDKFEEIAIKIIEKKFPSWKFIEPTHKNFDLKFMDAKTSSGKFVEVKGRSKPFSNASLEDTCYKFAEKIKKITI
jgi:hypothetical protein